MKPARVEASVMTSLHELRAIEQQRIEDERSAIEQARASEVAARELAERHRLAAEQHRERSAREERLRIEEAKVATEREAWLRIEAVEAAERVRHAAALEAQRVAQELELRRAEVAKTRPTWMIAVTALAVAAGIALAWLAIDAARQNQVSDDKQREAQLAADEAKQDALASRDQLDEVRHDLDEIDKTVTKLQLDLIAADTRAERERIRAGLDANARHRAAAEQAIRRVKLLNFENERKKGFDARECAKTPLGCMDNKH